MNDNSLYRSIGSTIAVAAGLAWSLLLNGAIPFVGMPALWQQLVMLGYAQSFANGHWYSIHAHAFGYPTPAVLVTGLPLAYVAGWALRLGFAIDNAYSLAAAIWLALAYWGAMRLARRLGCTAFMVPLSAATWLSLPIVWAHETYSSLALGIAMLPLYLNSTLALVTASSRIATGAQYSAAGAEFIVLAVVALFMDGYTFLMFAMATAVVGIFQFIAIGKERWYFLCRSSPVVVTGLALALSLYRLYTGHSSFASPSLGTFRGWGLDLTFLVRPSLGDIWLGDIIGFSVPRNASHYWGDFSVWTTTFALPLAIAGLVCSLLAARRDRRVPMLLCLALVGFYLALGPRLKIDTVKPAPSLTAVEMPAEYGLANTGSAWLDTNVPGIRNMRATYRWEALFLLGAWGLVAVAAGRQTRKPLRWIGLYLFVILGSTPHLKDAIGDYRSYREGLREINRDLVAPLSQQLPVGAKVLFLPWGNDVISVYLSSQLPIVSYNISGDKNIYDTRKRWPEVLQDFQMRVFTTKDLPYVNRALLSGAVDVIVVPYFDNFWTSFMWPCIDARHGYSQRTIAMREDISDFLCPAQIRTAYAGTIAKLRGNSIFDVTDTPLYALISLRPQYKSETGRRFAQSVLFKGIHFPLTVQNNADEISQLLKRGWAAPEPDLRWSSAHASLILPIPSDCQIQECKVVFRFGTFGASQQRPVDIKLTITGVASGEISQQTTVTDQAIHDLAIGLPTREPVAEIHVDVPAAVSPASLGMSVDSRVLGISLRQISIMRQ